ncbi:MAG: hypothetical protein HFE45_12515 [Oscillospiraceae bacterium]|nr:hypothetical protein [Oscillospiraceae bacterium]
MNIQASLVFFVTAKQYPAYFQTKRSGKIEADCGEEAADDSAQKDISLCTIRQAAVPAPMIPHSFCSQELLESVLKFKVYLQQTKKSVKNGFYFHKKRIFSGQTRMKKLHICFFIR